MDLNEQNALQRKYTIISDIGLILVALFWGDVSGPLAFFGQGAGGPPTDDSRIADLRAIAESGASAASRVMEAPLDDALLFGFARYADGTVRSGAFADLAREAKAFRGRHGFMAFEPAPELFEGLKAVDVRPKVRGSRRPRRGPRPRGRASP